MDLNMHYLCFVAYEFFLLHSLCTLKINSLRDLCNSLNSYTEVLFMPVVFFLQMEKIENIN